MGGPLLHRIRGASRLITIDATSAPHAILVSADGAALIVGCADGGVRVFNPQRRTLERTFQSHGGTVHALAFTPMAGARVALGCADGTVHFWPAPTGDIDAAIRAHTGAVRSVAFNGEGSRLISGGDDGGIRIIDLARSKAIGTRVTGSPLDGVRTAAFGAEKLLLGLTHAGVAVVWEGNAEQELIAFPVSDEKLLAARHEAYAVSPDRRLMASGRHDGQICLFRVDEPVSKMTGHEGAITAMEFSPHGRFLVSGGADCTTRIWDTTSNEQLCEVEHASVVRSVAFLADARHVVTALEEGALQILELHSDQYDLSDALTEAEAVIAGEPSQLWPSTHSAVDMDFLLDVWSELRRQATTYTPLTEEHITRGRALRQSLIDLMALLCEGEPKHLPGYGLDRYKHPLFRTALVDLDLATQLCARLGSDPLGMARVELLRSTLFPSSAAIPIASALPRPLK